MDLEEIKKHINEGGYLPEDVRYDSEHVHVGTHYYKTSRPRYWFAKVLGLWEQSGYMEEHMHGNFIWSTASHRYFEHGRNNVIGGNGFGYEMTDDGELFQMPHHGNVIIGDNVTIHNNVNIDRAVLGSTVIGDGSKIDSLVHIAHGTKVGKNVLICAGAVLCGSCEVGDYSFIGVNACIKQKVKIGRNCVIAAGAVVISDVPDNTVYGGVPAKLLKYTEPRDYKMQND